MTWSKKPLAKFAWPLWKTGKPTTYVFASLETEAEICVAAA